MDTHKTALILVDIQPGFITDENSWIIPNIKKLIRTKPYEVYVEAVFSAPAGSIWDKQSKWTFPKQDTLAEVKELIPTENYLFVEKTTKSVFKGNHNLNAFLHENAIQEVHIVGLDTNDCVFATANEAFDLGFFSYVIEDCTASSQSEELRRAALLILSKLDMVRASMF